VNENVFEIRVEAGSSWLNSLEIRRLAIREIAAPLGLYGDQAVATLKQVADVVRSDTQRFFSLSDNSFLSILTHLLSLEREAAERLASSA